MRKETILIGVCVAALLTACLDAKDPSEKSSADTSAPAPQTQSSASKSKIHDDRVLLWGDTHLHTKLSGDAYALANRQLGPEAAYRFAKGEPVLQSFSKTRVQLKRPLDFLVVSDHAEYMGVLQLAEVKDEGLLKTAEGRRIVDDLENGRGRAVFVRLAQSINNNQPKTELLTDKIRRPVWTQIIDAAEAANEPGKFTALIGWEWSSFPDGANLHRVVFTPDNGKIAQSFLPFSALSDSRPEKLWEWLEKTQESSGARFVSIPHNSNISKGKMFDDVKSDGSPIDAAYAKTRMAWEPVVEAIQVKGSSETHPALSPQDEFAGFEMYETVMNFTKAESGTGARGNYVRDALKRGLEIEASAGENPYKFGIIGSTDSHTSLSTADEDNFQGKYLVDSLPENKFDRELTPNAYGVDMSAQGLAAIWADENTRDGIYEAFRRKEVYATSGPRISLRVFAGWDFQDSDATANDFADKGYRKGVPMGSELPPAPDGEAPQFIIRAVKDPLTANLDRMQVIKGWLNADGSSSEKIYNVAWADDRKMKADGTLPAIGSTIDEKTGHTTNNIGTVELATKWQDPDFDPAQKAFYYVRVLEIPTARHTYLDALALQQPHPKNHDSAIQERAFSSPIWYNP